ncbi:MAG TPA: 4Fe-4S ferredoxin [Gallicola sp.]|jgi:coenzyme F420-reducing hydrogenase beta subunit|nr:4Fe-4S ferredoxin [Gallicola sp.]
MNNISVIKNCYGCGVCAIACPKKIIEMKLNKEGFYEPFINNINACNECRLCLDVCSFTHNDLSLKQQNQIAGYAAWSKDENIRYQCSSGGVSFEIGKYLINQGYQAIGVRYNTEKNIAEHYLAKTIEEFAESIGSKYIQSSTINGFANINKNDKFLITGTPCQIDSIRRYIKKFNIEENFILIDFFCHGVPSMLMWNKYLNQVQKKIDQIGSIYWRNKQDGWHDSWVIAISDKNAMLNLENMKNQKFIFYSKKSKGDTFYRFFLGHYCLGEQCHNNCKYKQYQSSADIRIGDLWSKLYENNQDGVSSVLTITKRGNELIKSIATLQLIELDVDTITEGQMKTCPKIPISRSVAMFLLKSKLPLKYIAFICKSVEYFTKIFKHPNL